MTSPDLLYRLAQFAHHRSDCDVRFTLQDACTCGFASVLSEYQTGYSLSGEPSPTLLADLDTAFAAIAAETLRAKKLYPAAFHSGHEGYGALLEEVEELWGVVRNHHVGVDDDQAYRLRLRAEATQVAAMAVRIILELT